MPTTLSRPTRRTTCLRYSVLTDIVAMEKILKSLNMNVYGVPYIVIRFYDMLHDFLLRRGKTSTEAPN